MAYPTRAALVAASSVAELTALAAAQQDALRAEAIVAVEEHTGQAFEVEGTPEAPVAKKVDGSGADVVYLPARLQQLGSLTHDGAAVNLIDVTATEDRLTLVSPLAGGSWVTRVRRSPGDPAPVWQFGRSNLVISGVWGWTVCPDAVATALRFHMEDQALANAHGLAGSVRSARALGLKSIRQGNLTAEMHDGEPELSARARRQVASLVWDGAGGFAA